jgi:hypothetical protein
MRRKIEQPPKSDEALGVEAYGAQPTARPDDAPSVRVGGAELAALVRLEDALLAWRWGVPGESSAAHELALVQAFDAYAQAHGIPLPRHVPGGVASKA